MGDEFSKKQEEEQIWWNNLPPQEKPATPEYAGHADDPKWKKPLLICMAVVMALVLICGGAAAGYHFVIKDGMAEENRATEEEVETPSSIYLTIYADGTNEKTLPAMVAVRGVDLPQEVPSDSEADAPKTLFVITATEVAVGEHVKLGELPSGSYSLTILSLPENEDGPAYMQPVFDMGFTVKGDAEPVELTLQLDQADQEEPAKAETPDKDQNSADKEEKAKDKPADTPADSDTASGTDGNSGSTGSGAASHTHSWVAQTKTVHHDAVYRTVHHKAVNERVTICDTCGQDITNGYSAHKQGTGHTGYHYETRQIQAAYDEKVLVSEAYDETVTTGYRCSSCGATK